MSRVGACRQGQMRVLGAALLLSLHAAASALGTCSRALRAPVAPLGLSVTAENGQVGGIYPELLRAVETGCRVEFSVVPRARQQLLFDAGKADLLVPATRTPARDEYAVFVPMVASRPVLISQAQALHAPVRSDAELLERRELRIAIVRGYDFGPEYRQLVDGLAAQGRLVLAADAGSVARLLDKGMADATLMNSTILLGAILADARLRGLATHLRTEPLAGLPWTEAGIYVSRRSGLSEQELHGFVDQLEALSRSGRVWSAFQRRFPPGGLNDSIRARGSAKEEGGDASR